MRRAALLLTLVMLGCGREQTVAKDRRPDVVLITVDTLRYDAPGFAGGVPTPFLDSVARDGIVFTNARAHNVVTLPSHANILTGLLPFEHGVRDNGSFVLAEEVTTLAEMLRAAGYTTGAFVGGFPLDARFGLAQGFDVYDDPDTSPDFFEPAERSAEEVTRRAAEWFNTPAAGPRFLWVHLYDPHAPYRPPEPFAVTFAADPYRGEIAAADAALQRNIAPLLDRSFVIFTSDHGEGLGDHGELRHGLFAYETTLRVPLVVMERGRIEPRVERAAVRHIDIVPTVLDRAGLAVPAQLRGKSLLAVSEPRPTYFEALSASHTRGWAPLVGLVEGTEKYIDVPLPELYDLSSDSAEQKNLIEERRRSVTRLRAAVRSLASDGASQLQPLAAEARAQLLSLGYVSGSVPQKTVYGVEDDPKRLVAIDTKMHQIVEAYQHRQIDRAVALAREVVAARPDMGAGREMLAVALNRRGMELAESGRAREALSVFDEAVQVSPDHAEAHQNLGVTALRTGDAARAHRHLSRALEINPRLPVALTTLGVLFARERRLDDAFAAWQRAVEIDPRQYDALFNLGFTAARTGRADLARSALERFIAAAPPQSYRREREVAMRILQELR